jgi:hypothetical protein
LVSTKVPSTALVAFGELEQRAPASCLSFHSQAHQFDLFKQAERRARHQTAVELEPGCLLAIHASPALYWRMATPRAAIISISSDLSCVNSSASREDDASRTATLRCCSATGQFGARRRPGKMIIQVNTEQPRSGCLTVLVSAHCLNLPQHLDLAFFALSGRVYARGSAAQAAGGAYPATARCRVCRQLVLALLNYSRRPF